MRHTWMALLSLGALLTGCGGVLGSCNEEVDGVTVACLEYEQYPLGRDMLRSACGAGATFQDGPCTKTNRTGRCRVTTTVPFVNLTTRIVYNYYSPMTEEVAQTTCSAYTDDEFTRAEFLNN